MGFVEFSSGNVDYIFDGVNHVLARRPDSLFNGIDALVIERPALDFVPEGFAERLLLISFFGNRNLLEQLKRERLPVYSVDVRSVKYQGPGEFFDTPSWSYWWYGLLYGVSRREIPKNVQDYMADIHYQYYPAGAARSAVSAEKITNHLAQRVKIERGMSGRRIRIGLIDGVGHVDIVNYIKSDERRTEALTHHQRSGFDDLRVEDLDVLLRYDYVSAGQGNGTSGWRMTKENTGLFDGNRLKRLS